MSQDSGVGSSSGSIFYVEDDELEVKNQTKIDKTQNVTTQFLFAAFRSFEDGA
jgi:hypothetical protein